MNLLQYIKDKLPQLFEIVLLFCCHICMKFTNYETCEKMYVFHTITLYVALGYTHLTSVTLPSVISDPLWLLANLV